MSETETDTEHRELERALLAAGYDGPVPLDLEYGRFLLALCRGEVRTRDE